MNKRFPYNTSDLKPSRRDFLRLSGAGMAAAMMARYGLAPILAQSMGEIPAELHPGSPNNPRGWTTTLPPIPDGMPALIRQRQSRAVDAGPGNSPMAMISRIRTSPV